MFSPKHIIILVLCVALIIGLFILAKNWSINKKYKAFLILAIVSETVKVFFYTIDAEPQFGGILPKIDLPFHLCSIQIPLTMVYCFSKSEKVKRAIIAFMMPSGLIGAGAALLIPAYPALDAWVITFQYFIYHAALMALSLSVRFSKELKVDVKDYVTCLAFIPCLMFASFYINSILFNGVEDINFMYVASPPQPGLPYLTETHGWVVYIVHYALLILTCITLYYVKPIVVWAKQTLRRHPAEEAVVEVEIKQEIEIEQEVAVSKDNA